MFLKILLVGALVFGGMVVIKDGRLLSRVGLTASCTQVSRSNGDEDVVQACKRGRLEGYPDLTNKSCVSRGVKGHIQYWSCPAPVVSSQTPQA